MPAKRALVDLCVGVLWFQAVQDGAQVEECLRGMRMHAVARVQNGQLGDAVQQIGRAGVGMAQDDALGAQSAEGKTRVLQALAFLDARGERADECGVRAEAFGRQLEGGPGAGARLVEEESHAAFGQPMGASQGVFRLEEGSCLHKSGNVGNGEIAGREQRPAPRKNRDVD